MAALVYNNLDIAGLPGPDLIAILTSEHPTAQSPGDGADKALLALYQSKFRDNVEFYGRILMAHPGVSRGEGSRLAN